MESLINEYFKDYSLEVREFLIKCFNYSSIYDKEYTNRDFELLLFIKSINPNFKIIFNKNGFSSFSFYPNFVISIDENEKEPGIFFHELTHLIHYCFNRYEVPSELNSIINGIKNGDNISNIISLLNHLKKVKKNIYKGIELKKYDFDYSDELDELRCIIAIEDIIDAIYTGKSHDAGLAYVKNDDYIIQTSDAAAGHGSDYYGSLNIIYSEIIANYSTIIKSKFKGKYLELLNLVLGIDLVKLLDNDYSLFGGSLFEDNLENNKSDVRK